MSIILSLYNPGLPSRSTLPEPLNNLLGRGAAIGLGVGALAEDTSSHWWAVWRQL